VPVSIPADERCIGVSISRAHCVVLTESGRAFASGKMSLFMPESDADAVSSSFLPVTPVGCSSDRVFLHAVAGEDCTVLIGTLFANHQFPQLFVCCSCHESINWCAREHIDLFSPDDSGNSSSSQFSIHVTGSKPWKFEVCICFPARFGCIHFAYPQIIFF